MVATKQDIRDWLNRETTFMGFRVSGCSHMLVVCDTFDYDDYPVWVAKTENVREVYDEMNSKPMQKVMEVYSYNHDLEEQLAEHRAFHFD